MLKRILTRLLTGLGVMWLAVTAAFLALHALPGRIEDVLAGDMNYPGLHEAIASEWGLDRSLPVQYGDFIGKIASGDLGTSYVMREKVSLILASELLPTVELALLAGFLAAAVAVALAVATAGRGQVARGVASAVEMLLTSSPVFWIGILLLMVFSFHFRLFPVSGADGWRAIVLPTITLALPTAGLLTQVLREAMEKTLDQPFVTTARARGLGETAVRLKHVLRHALLPAMTLGGWLVGGLLGGAVITEKVFGRPGLGSLTLSAVSTQDIPVVLAVVLLAAFIHVVISTLLDITYIVVDPRLRRQ
ncbi:MAG: ABC transporter permease [Acetobacteraceae bacterium]